MNTTENQAETILCVCEYRYEADEASHFSKALSDWYDLHNDSRVLRQNLIALGTAIDAGFSMLGDQQRSIFLEKCLEYPSWDFDAVPWVCEHFAEKYGLELFDGWVTAKSVGEAIASIVNKYNSEVA